MTNEIKEQLYGQNKPGMYIISFGSGFKFGIAKNLTSRVRSYNKPWSQPVEKVTTFPMEHKIARHIETEVKRHLNRNGLKAVDGSTEFVPSEFKMNQEEIGTFITNLLNHMLENGHDL